MAEFYSFGLARDTLNRRFGGGFPQGAIVLMTGEKGSGKSVMCQRITYGLLTNGYAVTYISTELTTEDFISQMRSMDFDIIDYLLDLKFWYIPVYPLVGITKPRKGFWDKLLSSRQLFDRQITIIDTFSALTKADLDERKSLETLSFLKKLCGMDKTIILTMEESDVGAEVMGAFKSVADVYLALESRVAGDALTHRLVVHRYGGMERRVLNVMDFRVEPKMGPVVQITEVV